MAAYNSSNRASEEDRSKVSGPGERNIWSSMLENVASGKRLPEKNILVLGGLSMRMISGSRQSSNKPQADRLIRRRSS